MILVKELIFSGAYEDELTREFTSPVVEQAVYYEIPNCLTDRSYQIEEGDSKFKIAEIIFHPTKIKYNSLVEFANENGTRCISDKDAAHHLITYWRKKFLDGIAQIKKEDPKNERIQILKDTYAKYLYLLRELIDDEIIINILTEINNNWSNE